MDTFAAQPSDDPGPRVGAQVGEGSAGHAGPEVGAFTFPSVDGRPWQVIGAPTPLELGLTDLTRTRRARFRATGAPQARSL